MQVRFRLFGKIIKVPKGLLIGAAVILTAVIILVAVLTESGRRMPELQRETVVDADDPNGGELSGDPAAGTVDPEALTSGDQEDVATPAPTIDTRMAVHITGAVREEGVYRLESGSIIQDVVDLCGGLLPEADTYSINLAMKVNDGMRIHIPFVYSEDKTWLLDVGYASEQPDNSGSGQSTVQLVNINTASVNELMTLNGIGESTARDIISYREEHGKFQSIEDIMNVPGIKDAKFNKIKKYITV